MHFAPSSAQIVQRRGVSLHEIIDHLIKWDVSHFRIDLDHGIPFTEITRQGDLSMFGHEAVLGILLLLAFFASYMSALSWADLTYVLPASSLGYVLLALVARFALHEQVSPLRWAGIALISGGVGFVAGGPSVTHHPDMGSESPSARPGAASGNAGEPPNQQHVRVATGGKP